MDSITSIVGGTFVSAAQSFGSEKIREKGAKFLDDKFIYPRLINEIHEDLKGKYSCCAFYNILDGYLTSQNVFEKYLLAIIDNAFPSKTQFEEYHSSVFKEKYPEFSLYDYKIVKECFEYIYDELKRKVLDLSIHTDGGKIQRTIKSDGELTRAEIEEVKKAQEQIMRMLKDGYIPANIPSSSPIQINLNANEDTECTSKAVNDFLKRIDSIGTPDNPISNDEEAIRKYTELSSEALVSLVGENPQQIKKVSCSIMCHIAIHHSNLGNIDTAFDHLSKVSPEIAADSKLYHFVNAAIIVNNGIKEKYEEANISINKVLELDPNHSRAFIVDKYLCALQKNDSLKNILTLLDTRFTQILTEDHDHKLLADYYLHRGLICKEFGEYDLAEKDFLMAKEKGYDPLILDLHRTDLYGQHKNTPMVDRKKN